MMIYNPHTPPTHENTKGTLKISDIRAENDVDYTHSVQQVNLLLQLPDEVVFVLVGLQQPDVLLTLSGQLLKTHTIQQHDYMKDKYFHRMKKNANGNCQVQNTLAHKALDYCCLTGKKITSKSLNTLGGWDGSKGVQVSCVFSSMKSKFRLTC